MAVTQTKKLLNEESRKMGKKTGWRACDNAV